MPLPCFNGIKWLEWTKEERECCQLPDYGHHGTPHYYEHAIDLQKQLFYFTNKHKLTKIVLFFFKKPTQHIHSSIFFQLSSCEEHEDWCPFFMYFGIGFFCSCTEGGVSLGFFFFWFLSVCLCNALLRQNLKKHTFISYIISLVSVNQICNVHSFSLLTPSIVVLVLLHVVHNHAPLLLYAFLLFGITQCNYPSISPSTHLSIHLFICPSIFTNMKGFNMMSPLSPSTAQSFAVSVSITLCYWSPGLSQWLQKWLLFFRYYHIRLVISEM